MFCLKNCLWIALNTSNMTNHTMAETLSIVEKTLLQVTKNQTVVSKTMEFMNLCLETYPTTTPNCIRLHLGTLYNNFGNIALVSFILYDLLRWKSKDQPKTMPVLMLGHIGNRSTEVLHYLVKKAIQSLQDSDPSSYNFLDDICIVAQNTEKNILLKDSNKEPTSLPPSPLVWLYAWTAKQENLSDVRTAVQKFIKKDCVVETIRTTVLENDDTCGISIME